MKKKCTNICGFCYNGTGGPPVCYETCLMRNELNVIENSLIYLNEYETCDEYVIKIRDKEYDIGEFRVMEFDIKTSEQTAYRLDYYRRLNKCDSKFNQNYYINNPTKVEWLLNRFEFGKRILRDQGTHEYLYNAVKNKLDQIVPLILENIYKTCTTIPQLPLTYEMIKDAFGKQYYHKRMHKHKNGDRYNKNSKYNKFKNKGQKKRKNKEKYLSHIDVQECIDICKNAGFMY